MSNQQPEQTIQQHELSEQKGFFTGQVIAHAAVNSGMIANFGRNIAKRLIKEGAELHVFASRLPVFGFPPEIEDLENKIGAKFHGLPLSATFAPVRIIWSLILLFTKLRRLRVKVLHTRSTVMGTIGRIAARLTGVPVIIHHQDDLYCRDSNLSSFKRRLVILIERTLAQMADRTLFVSEAVLKDALAIGFPPERCVLVGHDLNEVFTKAESDPMQGSEPVRGYLRAIGVPENAKIVGSIGRFTHLKGLDLFIQAAKELAPKFPGWVFVIKGDGPLLGKMVQNIAASGLEKQIFLFTNPLEFAELPALYRCMDIFALPTRREGFGMVFAEAMAMGVPTIGPRIAPVTEVINEEQGAGLLIEPESVPALVEALRALMSNADRRRQNAQQGQAYAIDRWCNEIAAARSVDVYRELVCEKELTNDCA